MYEILTAYEKRNVNDLSKGNLKSIFSIDGGVNDSSKIINIDRINDENIRIFMKSAWDNDLAIGIDNIDNQNKEIFNYINKLIYDIKMEKEKSDVIKTFDFLETLINKNFSEEEEIQKEKNYPKYKLQCKEHNKFKNELKKMRRSLENDELSLLLSIDIHHKIFDFMRMHIINLDKDFGAFLIKKFRSQ